MEYRSRTIAVLLALLAIPLFVGSCRNPEGSGVFEENDTAQQRIAAGKAIEARNEVIMKMPSAQWRPFMPVPGCKLRMAQNPSAIKLPFDWQPCKSGPEGCREIGHRLGEGMWGCGSLSLNALSLKGKVIIQANFSIPGPLRRIVLAPLDGKPFMAMEQPPETTTCSLGEASMSRDGAVVGISHDSDDGYSSRAYLRGPLREDPAWTRVAARRSRQDFPKLVTDGSLSVDGCILVAVNGGPVMRFDSTSKKWVEIPESHDGWAKRVEGHGDYFTFIYGQIPERLMAARPDGAASELLHVPKGGGASPVAIDGEQVVWIDGRGRDKNNRYQHLELLIGKISDDLLITDARVLTRLPGDVMVRPRFADGVVVVPLNRDKFEQMVITVADGVKRLLSPPPGKKFNSLLWINSEEVAMAVNRDLTGYSPFVFQRIPIKSMPLMPAASLERPL